MEKLTFFVQKNFFVLNRYRYPDYVVHGNVSAAQLAQVESRYQRESLKGLLLDIHFLSLCDYLVCTFSSGVNIFYLSQKE